MKVAIIFYDAGVLMQSISVYECSEDKTNLTFIEKGLSSMPTMHVKLNELKEKHDNLHIKVLNINSQEFEETLSKQTGLPRFGIPVHQEEDAVQC
jgi:hypothetical protein